MGQGSLYTHGVHCGAGLLARLGTGQFPVVFRHRIDGSGAGAMVVSPVTRLVTEPSENINWVYGPAEPQNWLPDLEYMGLLMFTFILLIYLPSHLLFSRFFPKK